MSFLMDVIFHDIELCYSLSASVNTAKLGFKRTNVPAFPFVRSNSYNLTLNKMNEMYIYFFFFQQTLMFFFQYRKSCYCLQVAFLFRMKWYSSRSAESQSAWRDNLLMYKIVLRNARTASCTSLIEVNETNPHFLFTTIARLTRSHSSFEPSISAALRGKNFISFLIKKK